MEKTNTPGMSGVREDLKNQGFSEPTVDIIMSSWRESTEKQYEPVIRMWFLYCQKGIDPYNRPLNESLNFLTELFNSGCSYDQIKNARSALSAVIKATDNLTFGKLPLVYERSG